MNNINMMLSRMESDLKKIGHTDLTADVNSEKALECVKDTFKGMRKEVMQNNFQSNQDEIHFFKSVRPIVASKISLITFVIQYTNTSSSPEQMRTDLIKGRRNYYKIIIAENRNYVDRMNRHFIEDDPRYFMRDQFNVPTNPLGEEVLHDPDFSTYHSLLLEKIIANNLIENFLNRTIEKPNNQFIPLKWTGSKRALVELMYSLHYSHTFNHGQLNIRKLTEAFECLFNIDLGDVYREFNAIKNRNEPTIFIDQLKDVIHELVDNEDRFRSE